MDFLKEIGPLSLADIFKHSPTFAWTKRSLDPDQWKRRAMLWFYLGAFSRLRPDLLENLPSEYRTRSWECSPRGDRHWFAAWCERYWLPNTSELRLEIDLTYFISQSTHGESPPTGWHFERLIAAHHHQSPAILEGGAKFAFATSERSVSVELPGLPRPDSDHDALEDWTKAALKTARRRVRELEALWKYRWGGLRALNTLEDEEPRLVRFLELLARKQARGASYKDLADVAYEVWEEEISEEGVRQGVLRAAEAIGLPSERIRDAPPGPRLNT